MARETGWLVEDAHGSGRPRYRYFDETGLVGWTEDPNKAIRFARRVDAENFSAADEDAWHVTEHIWDDGAAPEPPAVPPHFKLMSTEELCEFLHVAAAFRKFDQNSDAELMEEAARRLTQSPTARHCEGCNDSRAVLVEGVPMPCPYCCCPDCGTAPGGKHSPVCNHRPAQSPEATQVRAWMRMFEDGTWDVTHATWKWRKSDRSDPKQWEVIPLYERPAQPPRDG